MSAWSLRAPAKLNWTLEVLGRREDGFHELRSWFVALDWCDRLELHRAADEADAAEGGLVLLGPRADAAPSTGENLVLRAEAAWRAAGGAAPPLTWRLQKHLPSGAGLGGGSSDAAAALRLLQQAARSPLSGEALARVACALGSDVPFFLDGRDAELRGGRGEVLLARCAVPDRSVVVVVPPFAVPTARVYASLDAPDRAGSARSPHVEADPATVFARPGPNHLEAAARRAEPRMDAFRSALDAHAPFLMSGSGGAHFAPAAGEADADALAERLRADPVLAGCVVRAAALARGAVLAAPEVRA